jgi:hypothetical protein
MIICYIQAGSLYSYFLQHGVLGVLNYLVKDFGKNSISFTKFSRKGQQLGS